MLSGARAHGHLVRRAGRVCAAPGKQDLLPQDLVKMLIEEKDSTIRAKDDAIAIRDAAIAKGDEMSKIQNDRIQDLMWEVSTIQAQYDNRSWLERGLKRYAAKIGLPSSVQEFNFTNTWLQFFNNVLCDQQGLTKDSKDIIEDLGCHGLDETWKHDYLQYLARKLNQKTHEPLSNLQGVGACIGGDDTSLNCALALAIVQLQREGHLDRDVRLVNGVGVDNKLLTRSGTVQDPLYM